MNEIMHVNGTDLTIRPIVFPSAVVQLAGGEYEAHLPLHPVLVGATG